MDHIQNLCSVAASQLDKLLYLRTNKLLPSPQNGLYDALTAISEKKTMRSVPLPAENRKRVERISNHLFDKGWSHNAKERFSNTDDMLYVARKQEGNISNGMRMGDICHWVSMSSWINMPSWVSS